MIVGCKSSMWLFETAIWCLVFLCWLLTVESTTDGYALAYVLFYHCSSGVLLCGEKSNPVVWSVQETEVQLNTYTYTSTSTSITSTIQCDTRVTYKTCNSIRYNTIPYQALQHHPREYHADTQGTHAPRVTAHKTKHLAVQWITDNAVHTIQFCTYVPWHETQCNTQYVQYNTTPYHAVQCNTCNTSIQTVPCHTIQIQYKILLNI